MLTDREIMRDLAIQHLEGEGDYLLCSANECAVGEDNE